MVSVNICGFVLFNHEAPDQGFENNSHNAWEGKKIQKNSDRTAGRGIK